MPDEHDHHIKLCTLQVKGCYMKLPILRYRFQKESLLVHYSQVKWVYRRISSKLWSLACGLEHSPQTASLWLTQVYFTAFLWAKSCSVPGPLACQHVYNIGRLGIGMRLCIQVSIPVFPHVHDLRLKYPAPQSAILQTSAINVQLRPDIVKLEIGLETRLSM